MPSASRESAVHTQLEWRNKMEQNKDERESIHARCRKTYSISGLRIFDKVSRNASLKNANIMNAACEVREISSPTCRRFTAGHSGTNNPKRSNLWEDV